MGIAETLGRDSEDKPATPFLQEYYASLATLQTMDGMVVCADDALIQWCNPAFAEIADMPIEQIVGTPLDKILADIIHEPPKDPLERCLVAGAPSICLALSDRPSDDTLEMRMTPLPSKPQGGKSYLALFRTIADGSVACIADPEQISRAERKLLSQTSGWFYAAKTLTELLKIVSRCMNTLIPETSGQLFIYGQERDALELASHWGPSFLTDHIEPDDCWSLRRGRAYSYGTNDIDFICEHNDSSDNPSFCLPVVAHGETIGMLHLCFHNLNIRDFEKEELRKKLDPRWDLALICAEQISLAVANVRLRQELQNQSVRDQLTGLWNRRWFLETAQKELNRAVARQDTLALISFDIDHFKKFNDTHGHDAGDAVLRNVGTLMSRLCTGTISACRVGGEEFAVISPHTKIKEAAEFAEMLRKEVSMLTVRAAGVQLPPLTICLGVATVPECGEDIEALMKSADLALYEAKESGRNAVRTFEGDAPTSD